MPCLRRPVSGCVHCRSSTRSSPRITAQGLWSWDSEGQVSAMQHLNDTALLLGRLLVAGLFLPSGISKATGFAAFAASLAAKGLPYSEVWAAAAVAIEVLGPIALILGVAPRATALALIAFVIVATATTHR